MGTWGRGSQWCNRLRSRDHCDPWQPGFLFLDKRKGGEKMKKRITLLIAALMLALSMSFGGVAFAKITQVNGGGQTPNGEANGVPSTNPAGHEPGGHNK